VISHLGRHDLQLPPSAAFSISGSSAAISKSNPASAQHLARSSPIPVDAPVTIANFPSAVIARLLK
jgi:hypothetical protein